MKQLLTRIGVRLLAVLAIVLVSAGAFLIFLTVRSHGAYSLPQPTGPHRVGHLSYDWTDPRRTDAFVDRPQQKRELMVDVWYPTDQSSGAPAPYLPPDWQKAADADQGAGVLLKHTFAGIRTTSLEGAAVAAGRFPLLVFQPGYGRIAADYTSLAERLASDGYIVVASSPTYMSDLVVFSDGRIVRRAPQATLPDTGTGSSPAMRTAAAHLLDTWTGDDSFLIDRAIALDSDPGSPFHDRLQPDRIGVMGHSLGGAAAYQVCKTDTRCTVAIDVDGTLYGDDTHPSRVPFLYLSSDHSGDKGAVADEGRFNDDILAHQTQRAYRVTLADAGHFNFADLALYSFAPAMRLLGAVGSLDGDQGLTLSAAYVTDMCDTYLRSQPPRRLEAADPPKGVSIQAYNRP